jgi:hypothetical protein
MTQETEDPVQIWVDCLQNRTNKSLAFEKAQVGEEIWWAVDFSDQNLSQEKLLELLELRTIVMGTLAAVYVWNEAYDKDKKKLESEFLQSRKLWEADNREVTDIYLMLLMIQKQQEHLEKLFAEDKEFRQSFLTHYDIYASIRNPQYEFESDMNDFVALINRVNAFSRHLYDKI